MPIVSELIRTAISRHSTRPALVDSATDETYTYAQFGRLVYGMCEALAALEPGDRVAVCARNSVLWAATEAAVACSGLTLVPLNIYLSGGELAALLVDSGARALVFDRAQLPDVGTAIEGAPDCALRLMVAEAGTKCPPWAQPLPSVADMLATDDAVVLPSRAAPDTVHRLLYTSATTGRAKGVPHENQMFVSSVMSTLANQLHSMQTGDVLLVTTPLTHVAHGFFWPFFVSGNLSVLMPHYDPATFCSLAVRHGATHVISAPTLLADLVLYLELHPSAREAIRSSALKAIWYAGSPIPGSLAERADEVLGPILNQQYGLTEALGGYPSSGSTALTAEWHAIKRGSCGRPFPGVVLRIVDERGVEQPAGVEGEVAILMQAGKGRYWSLPEGAEGSYRDGWLYSGDLGYLDEDGFLYLRDRRTDMIVSGGLNIYPTEVESVLLEHHSVASCAVVGVADDRWIEVPHAVVVPREGATIRPDELIAFTRDRIAHYKAPKAVHVVERLPVGATGKILRREVRALLAARVAQGEVQDPTMQTTSSGTRRDS